jgi:TrpR-related protein YerC/YecD
MNKNIKQPRNEDMYKAILSLETVEECMKFFDDLCSISEIKAMEQRFHVALLLNQGMIYNDILEKTGASSATISRVNRSLRYGEDGYAIAFGRMKNEEKETEE